MAAAHDIVVQGEGGLEGRLAQRRMAVHISKTGYLGKVLLMLAVNGAALVHHVDDVCV